MPSILKMSTIQNLASILVLLKLGYASKLDVSLLLVTIRDSQRCLPITHASQTLLGDLIWENPQLCEDDSCISRIHNWCDEDESVLTYCHH